MNHPPAHRRLQGGPLVAATGNAGKLREITALLRDREDIRLLSAASLGLPAPPETGASFMENALIKARAAAGATGHPALADDSGLCALALDGAPGIHSARWAGPDGDFALALRRLEGEIAASRTPEDRRAAFVCALALVWPDGHAECFEGRVDGLLLFPPRGNGGFGYDPAFAPLGETRSYGEMTAAEKAADSHRSRAFALLAAACLTP